MNLRSFTVSFSVSSIRPEIRIDAVLTCPICKTDHSVANSRMDERDCIAGIAHERACSNCGVVSRLPNKYLDTLRGKVNADMKSDAERRAKSAISPR